MQLLTRGRDSLPKLLVWSMFLFAATFCFGADGEEKQKTEINSDADEGTVPMAQVAAELSNKIRTFLDERQKKKRALKAVACNTFQAWLPSDHFTHKYLSKEQLKRLVEEICDKLYRQNELETFKEEKSKPQQKTSKPLSIPESISEDKAETSGLFEAVSSLSSEERKKQTLICGSHLIYADAALKILKDDAEGDSPKSFSLRARVASYVARYFALKNPPKDDPIYKRTKLMFTLVAANEVTEEFSWLNEEPNLDADTVFEKITSAAACRQYILVRGKQIRTYMGVANP